MGSSLSPLANDTSALVRARAMVVGPWRRCLFTKHSGELM